MHAHHHHHHDSLQPHQYNKAFALAVILNAGFVVIEAIYGYQSSSMSLLADAGHNLGDVLGLCLAWLANMLLSRKPSQRYSYGHKKTTVLASLINALALVLTSALITVEAIRTLLHPDFVNEMTIIIVAGIGIFINGGTALLFWRGHKDDLNIKGAFLHLAYDAIISFGVVLTGIGIYFTQWAVLDPIVSLLIVIAILYGTWELLRDSVNLILDGVPHNIDHRAVKAYLKTIPGVTAVHDFHIWGLSTRETALTAHLVMPGQSLSDEDFKEINHHLLHHFHIHHPTLQVEQGECADPCVQTH